MARSYVTGAISPGVGPVGLFTHLLLVVQRGAVADVDDLRYRQWLERRCTLELGGEILGELAQQARDDALFLFAQEAAVLIGDTDEPGADGLDVAHVAARLCDLVE